MSFQEYGKPKYGNIVTQTPKTKSIRALRMDVLYQQAEINAKAF
ncbi:MAG: hypothetical protein UV76_C0004G0002 [Candidatus Nomurabacteria bacterium GW2011_GWA2_43_15]|uniref:Uncharacterized protein n=1 Tax=Candidatus Nomurabacteria bacterium GW2011_GWA2_43_15 TaxID=1618738 RepID=A0A0G1DTJ5_9BACT|nr:MAG: hypothetical protein UV76_C0004G0002 [Candidatus Nomurabacteria bacterium GW2011_GWA2_43_15]